MDNIWTILITSAATLVVTILGGLIIEYIKRIKSKLIYKITEAVPIKINNKTIGANVISLKNPSSKTIKDISVIIKTTAERVQDGGIKCTEGLEYNISTSGGILSVLIPFLKPKDEVSITAITEGAIYIPKKPDIAIRSPEVFKLVNADEIKEGNIYKMIIPLAAIASTVVALSLSIGLFTSSLSSEASINLTVAASIAGLPKLAEQYAFTKDVYYYSSGAIAYTLAKASNNIEETTKYKIFLQNIVELDPLMLSESKCAINFYLGKIEQLLNHNEIAQAHFDKAQNIDKRHYAKLRKLVQ
jgi:hypothetical protein